MDNMSMLDTEGKLTPYLTMAKERGADNVQEIGPSNIVTAPWVRVKCQLGCFGYGRSLCCPPHTPTPEQMRQILDSYSLALLLHRHWQKGYNVAYEFNEMVVDLEISFFLDGYYKAWSMGSSPCA
jgi:predicted metal-binding protein